MSSNNRDHTWPNGQDDHSFWPNPSHYDPTREIILAAVISSSAVIFLIFTLQTPKRGLDPSVIASLPTYTVGANSGDVGAVTECAVCLSVFVEQDAVRELPNCKHVFHVDCVDTWLTTCSTCPVCRTEVQPRTRLEPEPREGPVGDGVSPQTSTPSFEEVRLSSLSVSRLDSFRIILTRERSSNLIYHSCVD